MFLLGVILQLVFMRPLRGRERDGALAARHLGARARDRGPAQRHLQDDVPRRPSRQLRRSSLDVAGYHFSVVRVLAFVISVVAPRRCCSLLLTRTGRPRDPRHGAEPDRGDAARGRHRTASQTLGFGLSVAHGGGRRSGVRRSSFRSTRVATTTSSRGCSRSSSSAGSAASAERSSQHSSWASLEAIFAVEISPTWPRSCSSSCLIAFLLVRPQGLFGVAGTRLCEPRFGRRDSRARHRSSARSRRVPVRLSRRTGSSTSASSR